METNLFGWAKDPYSHKDYLHVRKLITLPPIVNHSGLLSSVRKQLASDCVGHGEGMAFNGVKKALGIFEEWCSPTFIYNGARSLEGHLSFDNGCFPRDGLEWTRLYGILLEKYWPYAGFERCAPSSERIKQADKYKGFQYWRAVDGIDGLCDALASGYLVAFGTPWFKEWVDSPPCGRLPTPTNNSFEIGGHETCLYGYDNNEGIFLGVNSWGMSWGDNGKYKMPYESIEIFKNRGGYDAHYISFTTETESHTNDDPKPCVLSTLLQNLFRQEER